MLNPSYVIASDLQSVFVDPSTGLPLAAGTIEFWEDDDRTTPKSVYQLTGAPPNYTYTPLPNPVTLSAGGTMQDNNGDDIIAYYLPYTSTDADAEIQLYYVVVKDSFGAEIFPRQAWPNTTISSSDIISAKDNVKNALSNPTFSQVLFDPTNGVTISLSGGPSTLSVPIAPDWTLNVTYKGDGTVQVSRTAIAGSLGYPYNPPYVLNVVAGANISSLTLTQRLYHNPDIWSPSIAGATNGWINGSFLLSPGSEATMRYKPSVGMTQIVLSAANDSGSYEQKSATIQLVPCDNSNTSDTGYVDIEITLGNTGTTNISNIQVAGLNQFNQPVIYDEEPVNRQLDYLFHYYNAPLQAKAIPSYLIGWDFPLNPAQFLGDTVPESSAGANTSAYVWDQTIVFQTANSGPAISRSDSGAMTVTATNTTQFALVQYVPQVIARKILNNNFSVNVSGSTNLTNGILGTVAVYYTTDDSLPSTTSNNSIVATLDSQGHPASLNGDWMEVPRGNLGNAQFMLPVSTNTNYADVQLSGWDMKGIAACNTTTWVAIVVGFSVVSVTNTVDINSISLVPGSIATRPAPQDVEAVLRECETYYWKTFLPGVVPIAGIGANSGEWGFTSYVSGTGGNGSNIMLFPVQMYSTPTLTIYSPVVVSPTTGFDQIYNNTATAGPCTSTATHFLSKNGFIITANGNSGAGSGSLWTFHATADARLGL